MDITKFPRSVVNCFATLHLCCFCVDMFYCDNDVCYYVAFIAFKVCKAIYKAKEVTALVTFLFWGESSWISEWLSPVFSVRGLVALVWLINRLLTSLKLSQRARDYVWSLIYTLNERQAADSINRTLWLENEIGAVRILAHWIRKQGNLTEKKIELQPSPPTTTKKAKPFVNRLFSYFTRK